MKKIMLCILSFITCFSLSGCQKEKRQWKENYQITYFYVQDCPNCKHFKEDVIPKIKDEFGTHMKFVAYDMDTDVHFEEMKEVYTQHIDQIIDFNQDDYGFGPMVFLEGYIAILGSANADDYVDHLISAIDHHKMDEAGEKETYYYLKNGKVKK